jgi:SecD/SecF fusion protein
VAQADAQAACAQPGDPRRRVAIVLDDKVISSPQVTPEIQCGAASAAAARRSPAASPRRGEEPLDPHPGRRAAAPGRGHRAADVGPTLGAAAIDASRNAAIIGLVLTACSSRSSTG